MEVILILTLDMACFCLLKEYSFPNKLCYDFHYFKKFVEIQSGSSFWVCLQTWSVSYEI
jgi:hypothetical protein